MPVAPDSRPSDVSSHLAHREGGQRDKVPENEAIRLGQSLGYVALS